MAIQHIIFDLDGTLMDTEKGNLYAWQKTLRYWQFGVQMVRYRRAVFLHRNRYLHLYKTYR